MFLGITLGMAADRLCGDPPNAYHPVAIFGRYAIWVEKRIYQPTRTAGAAYVALTVIPPVVSTLAISRMLPPRGRDLLLGLSLFSSLGGTTLERIGDRMASALEAGDDEHARSYIPWLCSRDPELLNRAEMARATTESLAENTSDSAIAPLCWALCGPAGVVFHRTINTLDAMVGYKNPRYQEFGWAAAQLDDIAAYIPARVTTFFHLIYALRTGRLPEGIRALRTQAPHHPSPNAGPVEATAAAALGIQLGGPTHYHHGVEMRPILGFGQPPDVPAIKRAIKLSRFTQWGTYFAIALPLIWRAHKKRSTP
ncbi:adenosylcobinamide-phosphate synthase CbiB [Corynebacterium sp. ES2794-CONJ1]|uniref:adenosylcobinamide-phosphate synthase CbiB n=1 Tax=unclassified Corynebacterium TaxID=2624378 RepID=UPI00216A56E3|nr:MULTISPECIES: adenosylcobinamide-phosphate synthase CbiB [unclassified Corynebacterium]MCS4490608.1 adenosylcobinamide-phosphate synthase CbiB [Corynebacterium sp. ES2775-CONJ]MCU9519816.1 adenosylcobinamide-phosphate synthase CbiB [Corynebacterium sp. ES2794-CONJ1]